MFEQYLAFFAAHNIAVVAFVVQLAIRPLTDHLGLQPDDDELTEWVRRYRNLPKFRKGILDGVLLTVSSLGAEWYILQIAVPRLTSGPFSALVGVVPLLIGAGIGVSIGKAITEKEYTWFDA